MQGKSEKAIAHFLAPYAITILQHIPNSWCFKGGGAAWLFAVQFASLTKMSSKLMQAVKLLGMFELHDLDFDCTSDVFTALQDARRLAKAVTELPLEECATWARQHGMCFMNTSPELAYRDRTCTILGTNHNPLSLSLHNGQNDRTGEKYTLLRLGFAMHRTGEDILRIPYIDVNIAKKDKFILEFIDVDESIVLNGILMKHPKAIHDDILRVLFRETGWAPWLLHDEKKWSRRTRRLCGLTLLMDYPAIQRWDALCNLVDKVRDMDAAFSYSGRRDCVLRELGCLSAHGGVFSTFVRACPRLIRYCG